jgi:hypothetical protein
MDLPFDLRILNLNGFLTGSFMDSLSDHLGTIFVINWMLYVFPVTK